LAREKTEDGPDALAPGREELAGRLFDRTVTTLGEGSQLLLQVHQVCFD
jgi:hypothetical protein